MKIKLNFSLGQSSEKVSSKVAKFPSIELKEKYVEEEYKNKVCQEAYFKYQAARTPEDRMQAASNLDMTRYNFFKKWVYKNLPNEKEDKNEGA